MALACWRLSSSDARRHSRWWTCCSGSFVFSLVSLSVGTLITTFWWLWTWNNIKIEFYNLSFVSIYGVAFLRRIEYACTKLVLLLSVSPNRFLQYKSLRSQCPNQFFVLFLTVFGFTHVSPILFSASSLRNIVFRCFLFTCISTFRRLQNFV